MSQRIQVCVIKYCVTSLNDCFGKEKLFAIFLQEIISISNFFFQFYYGINDNQHLFVDTLGGSDQGTSPSLFLLIFYEVLKNEALKKKKKGRKKEKANKEGTNKQMNELWAQEKIHQNFNHCIDIFQEVEAGVAVSSDPISGFVLETRMKQMTNTRTTPHQAFLARELGKYSSHQPTEFNPGKPSF